MNMQRPSKTYGHLACHYRNEGEGPLAARLLRTLGFMECYSAPQPDGHPFFHFVIDEQANRGTDRILYLMGMPKEMRAVFDEIKDRLSLGTAKESAAVTALKKAQESDPEFGFHAAVVLHSLEELEELTQRVQRLIREDKELASRIKLTINRAKPGTPEVDKRMDASPVFGNIKRYTYGRNGVQVFVETDLLVGGVLGDNWVFEFDYVFPGYDENILNLPSDAAVQAVKEKEKATAKA
jgi:hypothetical protein